MPMAFTFDQGGCLLRLSGLPPPWEFDSLRETARRFEEQGFRLCALEGDEFDMSRNGIKHYNIRDFLTAKNWQ